MVSTRYSLVKSEDQRVDIIQPKPKAPYERPELKKIGQLRDVTATTTTDD